MFRHRKKRLALVISAVLSLSGCADKPAAPDTSSAATSATTTATANVDVVLLDGKVQLRIPADFEETVKQGGVTVYMRGKTGITLMGVDAPPDFASSAAVVDQTIANLTQQDPKTRVISSKDQAFGSYQARTAEIQTTTNGLQAHMVIALALMGDRMVTVQVTGPRDDATAIKALAQAIFDSVQVK